MAVRPEQKEKKNGDRVVQRALGYVPQSKTLGDVEAAIVKAVSTLERVERIDTIMCIGASGLLVAPQVAYRIGCGLFIARKSGDTCHGDERGCGELNGGVVFLDDIISTGLTFRRALNAACRILDSRGVPEPVTFTGAYFYGSLYGDPAGWVSPSDPRLARHRREGMIRWGL